MTSTTNGHQITLMTNIIHQLHVQRAVKFIIAKHNDHPQKNDQLQSQISKKVTSSFLFSRNASHNRHHFRIPEVSPI